MKHPSGSADASPRLSSIAEASNRTRSIGTVPHRVFGYLPVEFRGATGTADRGPRQEPAESADPQPTALGGAGTLGGQVQEEPRDPNHD